MAIGDDALAAGMTLVSGAAPANTLDTLINGALDEIARRTAAVMPIAKGGTGATTVSAARNALGLGSTSGALPVANGGTGSTSSSGARSALGIAANNIPTTGSNVQADIDYLAGLIGGKVNKGGDSMSGDLYLPASSTASSGWTTAYINGDGRVCRGASSLRYKKYVSEVEPATLGDIFPPLHRFQMKGGSQWTYGFIAEHLSEIPDTDRFVMRDADGRPDSIDYVPLLLAQVASLNARLTALEEGP
jgi:hypothetical protein